MWKVDRHLADTRLSACFLVIISFGPIMDHLKDLARLL